MGEENKEKPFFFLVLLCLNVDNDDDDDVDYDDCLSYHHGKFKQKHKKN